MFHLSAETRKIFQLKRQLKLNAELSLNNTDLKNTTQNKPPYKKYMYSREVQSLSVQILAIRETLTRNNRVFMPNKYQ